jgi:hypothetical protein
VERREAGMLALAPQDVVRVSRHEEHARRLVSTYPQRRQSSPALRALIDYLGRMS